MGWAAGAGVEYAVTDYFLVRAEYLFVGIARYTTFTGTVFSSNPPVPLTTSINDNMFRVGLSYKLSDKFWMK